MPELKKLLRKKIISLSIDLISFEPELSYATRLGEQGSWSRGDKLQ
jgi:hypothetical protein